MADSLIGLIVNGRYELQELLGETNITHIFAAHDQTLDRQVIIKVVKAGYAAPPDAAGILAEEMRAIARLRHPHILSIYDLGTETMDGTQRLYLVTPLLPRRTLADRLETGSLSRDETGGILKETCEALNYAHEQGVLHLNLEPNNILLDDEGHVRVTEFGLARLIEEITYLKAYVNTPAQHYVSPEQSSGDQVGAFSDVYAVGIILHQMLTGRLPEREWTNTVPLVRPSQSLPPALQTIIQVATRPDPRQRYPTATELAEAFTAALHPFPAHVITLRQALRQLAKFCSSKETLGTEQNATYAFTQSGIFSALGYGEPGKEEFLQRQPWGIVLGAPAERPLAVVAFMSPNCPPQNGLMQLKQQHTADCLPDLGVLCDGCELWLYRRTESDFYPHPTLHLSLQDATDLDAQALYEWLGRHKTGPRSRRTWVWLVAGGLTLLTVIVGLFLSGMGDGLASRIVSIFLPVPPITMPSYTPTALSSPTPRPSSTPTAPPSPTATIIPYLKLVGEQLNVYAGPGIIHDSLGSVHKGERIPLLGRSESGRWLQVQYHDHPGWIVPQLVVANVDLGTLPVIETPTPPPNHPPDIERVDIASTMIEGRSIITVSCQASDQDQDPLTYMWAASAGSVIGEGEHVVYYAPQAIGSQTIEVTVRDGHGSRSRHTIQVLIASVIASSGTFEPSGVFGQLWYAHSEMRHKLSGATGEDSTTDGAQQFFERGQMLWRKDTRVIYVLTENGTWQRCSDTWEESMDIYSCPEAAQQTPAPIRGFGKVWCEQLGGSNAKIGWATTDEQPYTVHWQGFKQGLMGQGLDGSLAGYIYALYEDDNSWQLYPPPTSEGPSSCPYAPRQRVQVADRARVCTGHERLDLHAQPQQHSSEITSLESGTLFTVIDGPVCANGWSWWKIHTDSGTVGWVAEGGNDIGPYSICPSR